MKTLPSFISRLAKITALAALFAGAHAHANVPYTFVIDDGIGLPNAVTIAPGDSFTFNLSLSAGLETYGLSYFLETTAPGSGNLRITARDNTSSPFSDFIAANSIALQPSFALLNPRNDVDLGAISATEAGPGQLFVANFTFQSLPSLAPGNYVIYTSLDSVATYASTFEDVPVIPAVYNVTVVPEPASAALLGLAGLGLALRRRRKV